MKNDLRGAEEKLESLLAGARQQCASPGAISQSSQKALPDGEPMELEEIAQRRRSELSSFSHSLPPPALADAQSSYGAMSSSSGLLRVPQSLEGAIPSGAASSNHLGGAIPPIADVEMREPNRSGMNNPHETMIVTGPPSPRTKAHEQTSMDWQARSTKRPLDSKGGTPKDKKAAPASPDPSTSQLDADRQMAEAKYYVQRMSQENAELGQQLAQQGMAAHLAAQEHLQKSNLSEQQREAELQGFRQMAEGLARSYNEQTRINSQQVISDREKGLKANLTLQNELNSACLHYQHMETEAKAEMQTRDGATNYWRKEMEQESQIAARNSEQSRDAERRWAAAENALRQKPVADVPKDQKELHHRLMNVEQEAMQYEQQAMQYVKAADQRAELAMENSTRQIRSLTDELHARQFGLEGATRKGGEAEEEITRLGSQLAQERYSSSYTRQCLAESKESTRVSEQKCLEALTSLQNVQTDCSATFQSFKNECRMYREEVDQSHEEQRLYEKTYDCWENLKSSLPDPLAPAPIVPPPGLPAGSAKETRAPKAPAEATTPDTKSEDVALKIKEADKITPPPYPTITNLMGWQSNLGVSLVQASGVRNVEKVIFWISAVWAKDAQLEDFSDSGGSEFVTLDIKLSMAMNSTIAHGGQDARELKDVVNRKMEEHMKKGQLLKGRQIVFMILQNFKTFDNSELVYGFDHLARHECGKDLHEFLTQWQKILDNMCSPLPTSNLRDVFYRKIKDVVTLQQDMNKYQRFRENDPNKTYEWLLEIVQQEIRLQRQDRNTA